MKIKKMPGFGSYGAIVEDFDWNDASSYTEIRSLLLKSLVVIIRGQGRDNFKSLSNYCYNIFTPRNGNFKWALKYGDQWQDQLTDAEKSASKMTASWALGEEFPGWSRVSGIKDDQGQFTGAFPECELLWHNDEPASLCFYPVVALYAERGVVGSSTCFLQSADWYDGLSESFRSELDELIPVFNMNLIYDNLDAGDRELIITHQNASGSNRMPLVVRGPGGQTGVRYSDRAIEKFEGMSKEDSSRIVKKIQAEVDIEKYRYDHWWDHQQGDLLLIDNSVTRHQRQFKSGLDMKTELGKRNLHRAIADITDDIFYDPYLLESYSNKRQEQMKLINDLDCLSVRAWQRHLPLLSKLTNKDRFDYIKNHVSGTDRPRVIAALKS